MASQSPTDKVNSTEANLGEARQEIVQILQTWLDREVKDRYQQIDQKLDLLVSAVSQRGRTSRKTGIPTLLSPRGLKARKRDVTFAEPPKRRVSTESVASLDGFCDSWPLPSPLSRGHTTSALSSPRSSLRESCETSPSFAKNRVTTLNIFRKRTNSISFKAEDPVPRRKLTSQRYMHEVQEFIAQHQGRGHKAVLIWRFLENPYSSTLAWLYSIFIPIFVLTSVVISFLQTVRDSPLRGGVGMWMQAGFESVYAAELIVRFSVCPDRFAFFCSVFNWIDFASSLPIVLRIFADRDQLENDNHVSTNWAKTVVVTLPLVRLLKIVRRFEKFHLLLNAFSMAFEALPVLLYTLMLIALFFSVLIYFFEPEEVIGSLPISIWFVFVTMTTVGYGDHIPITVQGRFCTIIMMICSFLYMAIPIGIVGNAFSQVWGNRDRLLLMHRIRESFLNEGFTAESMRKIVAFFDEDGDGELDLYEFKVMLSTMHVDISEERVMLLHSEIDKDGDGTINVVELINSLFPKGYLEAWRHSVEPRHALEACLEDELWVAESPQAARTSVTSEGSPAEQKSPTQADGVRFDLPAVTVAWNK